jgi:hypothetical protein
VGWSPTEAGKHAFANDLIEHSSNLCIFQHQPECVRWIFVAGFDCRSPRLFDRSDQVRLMFDEYLFVRRGKTQATQVVGATTHQLTFAQTTGDTALSPDRFKSLAGMTAAFKRRGDLTR